MRKAIYAQNAKELCIREIKKEQGFIPSIDPDIIEEDTTHLYNDLIIDLYGTLDYHIKQSIRCNY